MSGESLSFLDQLKSYLAGAGGGLNTSVATPVAGVTMPGPSIGAGLADGFGAGAGAMVAGVPGAQPAPGGAFQWLNSTDKQGVTTQGVLGAGLGAAQGVMNAWMGMKQYGLAKKTLAENTRQFNLNYDAQRQTTNAQLEDRQRARVASNSGAYQSVGDYMGAHAVR